MTGPTSLALAPAGTLAAGFRQAPGHGQFIDVGLVDVGDPKPVRR